MYQLVVQRILWHWTWPQNSLLNRVSSRHEPMYVQRTLLQLERGQSGNILVIVVSCHSASMKPVYVCWSHRYVTWSWCGFPATSTFLLRCAAWLAAKSASWLGLSPSRKQASVQAPCFLRRAQQFACLWNDRCCSALEPRDRMWLWLNTRRLVVW